MLDLHFSPHRSDVLAIAASTGIICLFDIEPLAADPIRHTKTIRITDPSSLVLSLAWCPSKAFSSTLAASSSDGRITTFDYTAPESSVKSAVSHPLEAWIVGWSTDRPESLRLFSGGDDSTICKHRLTVDQLDIDSSECTESAKYHPLQRDRKIHMAGVTAILPLSVPGAVESQILLTGSYDEYIRVLTTGTSSSNNRFQVLAGKRLHGGVWRLKLLESTFQAESTSFVVLASCMHAGARIIKVKQSKEDNWTIEVVARFEEHESMNYASDARLEPGTFPTTFTIISTSFYDRKLCMWKYEKT